MSDATNDHEPVIHDKRKLDPETGKARVTPPHATPTAAEQPSAPSAGSPDRFDIPPGATHAAGLADLKAENAQLADDLARANASFFNISQEYSGYVRRSKEAAVAARQAGVEAVSLALLSVLDDVDLARQHGDLEGPFKSVAEKLEHTLATNFGLERYGQAGDEFDPTIHEALMDSPSADVTVAQVSQVIQPGYRMGEKVIRPARVAVTSPHQ